ncbi:MAG: hypothetical protein ACRD4Q_09940 [Candidatus Acidiferrales bacterium]
MRILKKACAVAVAVSMLGAAVVPAFAFSTPQNQVQAVTAQVVPTAQEAQTAILALGHRMHDAELAGFTSPTSQSDYLQAQREFAHGRYDQAVSSANKAQAALPNIPNWQTEAQISR